MEDWYLLIDLSRDQDQEKTLLSKMVKELLTPIEEWLEKKVKKITWDRNQNHDLKVWEEFTNNLL